MKDYSTETQQCSFGQIVAFFSISDSALIPAWYLHFVQCALMCCNRIKKKNNVNTLHSSAVP